MKKIRVSLSLSLMLTLLFCSCNTSNPTAEELFEENFHPFPNIMVDLESKNLDSTFEVKSFMAYRQKEYSQALKYFDQIPSLEKEDPVQLYRGVCNLALGNATKAKEILLPLTTTQWEQRDAANWYLALAALKDNNLKETKDRLQLLTDRSTYIRNEAQVLISKLNNVQ